ncbi:MAG: TonB-dependent receptor, partial [Pseudomonadota bacterium]
PTVQSAGTVPFNEDVTVRFRPFSTTNTGGFIAENTSDTLRFDASLTGNFGDNWEWSLSGAWSRQEIKEQQPDVIFPELERALLGQGGPNDDQYFNPFGSAIFATPGSPLYNDPAVGAEFSATLNDTHETSAKVVDAIVSNGALFELPAGNVGFAAGIQYRDEFLAQDFDELKESNQVAFFGNGDVDFEGDSQTTAIFAEFAIPVFSSSVGDLDLSIAGRYEEESDSGLDSFNPKVSALFDSDRFSIRGSYATSFLAPSLFQRFGAKTIFEVILDPLNPSFSDATNTRLGGTADVDPQDSTSYNFGVTVRPTENLSVGVDFWSFEFEDLLAAPSAQSIIDADPNGPLITRRANGTISVIERPFFNAGSLEADGLDFTLSYIRGTQQRGTYTVDASATYVTTYDIQELPGGPVIDGVGDSNVENIGNPIPEYRGFVRFGWLTGNHRIGLTARHTSEVVNTAFGIRNVADAMTVLDAQYSYDFANRGLDGVTLTVGAINLFDEKPNVLRGRFNSFYVQEVQDPLGRRVYFTMNWAF